MRSPSPIRRDSSIANKSQIKREVSLSPIRRESSVSKSPVRRELSNDKKIGEMLPTQSSRMRASMSTKKQQQLSQKNVPPPSHETKREINMQHAKAATHLPQLQLSPIEKEKYFGSRAKTKFHHQISWLSHRNQIFESPSSISLSPVRSVNGVHSKDSMGFAVGVNGTRDAGIRINEELNFDFDSDDEFEASYSSMSTKGSKSGKKKDRPAKAAVDVYLEPASPRSKYIEACLKDHLNPRAALVLRKRNSIEMHLNHMGIGDKMGRALADSFSDLPMLQFLDISDNNFTDKALAPIINAISKNSSIIKLDISQNVIGPQAAQALSSFLKATSCSLRTFHARCADIDDYEAQAFILAIKENKTLRELDLSNNLMGVSENLNTVRPEIVTGGEALAELLRNPECVLKELRVGWNMIRMESAVDLCRSLAVNTSLVHLDLSFNAIGHNGGIALGSALLDNRTLKRLLLTTNALDAVACITICAGVLENYSLKHINLDGNPIGEQGARAAMIIPAVVGSRVKLSLRNCNITHKDPGCNFNFADICRDYELNLWDPFERAIALLLLHTIASHHTYVISRCEHEAPRAGGSKQTTLLNLVPFWNPDRAEYFDENQRRVELGIRRLLAASENKQSAVRFFRAVDKDDSGEIDREEFACLLHEVGLVIDETRVDDIFDMYDTDQGGTIGLSEFLAFLRREHEAATHRLRDLLHSPAFCLAKEPNVRYIPPRTGKMLITVMDGFQRKPIYRTITYFDRSNIHDVTDKTEEKVLLTLYSVISTKMRLEDALAMYSEMAAECRGKAKILAAMLPQLDNTADARVLTAKALEKDKSEMLALKRTLGSAIKPMMGVVNTYFVLNLARDLDRLCLVRLLEISKTREFLRQSNSTVGADRAPDISQKGNYNSSFRNEMYNNKPVVIDAAFANPMPKAGVLSFDFCGGEKPTRGDMVATDARVTKTLMDCFLMPTSCIEAAFEKLEKYKRLTEKCLNGDGNTIYEADWERAKAIGDVQVTFYDQLPQRLQQTTDAVARECISTSYDQEALAELKNLRAAVKPVAASTEPSPAKSKLMNALNTMDHSSHHSEGGSDIDTSLNGLLHRKNVPKLAVVTEQLQGHKNSTEPSPAPTGRKAAFQRQDSVLVAKTLTLRKDEVMGNIVGPLDISKDTGVCPGSVLREEMELERQQKLKEEYMYPRRNKKTASGKGPATAAVLRLIARGSDNKDERKEIQEFTAKFGALLSSSEVSAYAKAARVVELLEDCFSRLWIYCRHLALILEMFFELGSLKRTDFGTYRVEICVTLFERIVDPHNFEMVIRILTPFEAGCVYCRLGWTILFNPMKPEGSYNLDLSVFEERMVMKILNTLTKNEPGENWVKFEFAWERSALPVPRLDLVESWITEKGLPRRGFVYMTYYSGEGKHFKGCNPNINLRKSLLQLVYSDEEDVIPEDRRDYSWDFLHNEFHDGHHDTDSLQAKFIPTKIANLNFWRSYLVLPPASADEKDKEKEAAKEN